MSRIRVAPIVEGHGEVPSVPILLRRLWIELLGGEYIEIFQPIRNSQGRLLQEEGLRPVVELAMERLNDDPADDPSLILILIDSEGKCPASLGPRLLQSAKDIAPDHDIACVLAHRMYENWFVAAARSLQGFLRLSPGDPVGHFVEDRSGASWISKRFRDPKYTKTFHQPKMTHAMDLAQCRAGSPSFDKLCRELEKRRHPDGRSVEVEV